MQPGPDIVISGNEVPRANRLVSEAIDVLNNHLMNYSNDPKLAWLNLGKEERSFIEGEYKHCITDPRYYMNNYHIVQAGHEGIKTLYPFWDSQEIFYQMFLEMYLAGVPIRIIVLKARQLGISTISEALIFWKTIFTPNCTTLIVAQDPSTADHQFTMSRLAYDSLPWWMRPERRYEAKGRYLHLDRKDDVERQLNPGLRSVILVEAANKMTGVARGKTIRCAHFSELASWENGGILAEQIFPTMHAPDELAFMESTAEGRRGFWYKFWVASVSGKTEWKPLFIPCYRRVHYVKPIPVDQKFDLTNEEQGVKARVLKRDGYEIADEHFNWRRQKIQDFINLEGDEWKFFQEYPYGWIEAFQASGLCAFPKRKLAKILDTSCIDPIWIGEVVLKLNVHPPAHKWKFIGYYPEIPDPQNRGINMAPGRELVDAEAEGARLRVWDWPQDGESYYVGGDVALGNGGDYSCAQVFRIGHGSEPDEQVAEWHGWAGPTEFADFCAALGFAYNDAEIAIEVDGVGLATYLELSRQIEYPNLFRWKHYDKIKNPFSDLMGWVTTWKNRPLIISRMRESLIQDTIILHSERLLDQMMDFGQSDEDDKIQGQETPDDRVMAALICNWCAHDSDYGKAAQLAPRIEKPGARYYVFDGLQRRVGEFENRQQAIASMFFMNTQGHIQPRANWSMREGMPKRDFFNTDYSPVHDKPGIRAAMYEAGVAAENINVDTMVEFGPRETAGDWRTTGC